MLAFGWAGSRNNDPKLIEAISLHNPGLPFGIKNGLDGSVEIALNQVEIANELREGEDAPVVLIFRGGNTITDPELWEDAYLNALRLTKGRVIVDTAHGTEMAHDPQCQFSKTIKGQILALEHVIEIASSGFSPAGIMIEASDLVSRTDPHMPLKIALNGITELVRLKRSQYAL